ncbi:hypothetical protein AB0N14_27425 [Streptomyces sp. NPDC051104]
MVGTVFFEHLSHGPTRALTGAMPWVTGVFVLSAALCVALPRRAVAVHEE